MQCHYIEARQAHRQNSEAADFLGNFFKKTMSFPARLIQGAKSLFNTKIDVSNQFHNGTWYTVVTRNGKVISKDEIPERLKTM